MTIGMLKEVLRGLQDDLEVLIYIGDGRSARVAPTYEYALGVPRDNAPITSVNYFDPVENPIVATCVLLYLQENPWE